MSRGGRVLLASILTVTLACLRADTLCADGTYSYSTGRGTCSKHGGIAKELQHYPPGKPHTEYEPEHRSSALACSACARNSKGRIARYPQARREFMRSHPCPSTGQRSGACPGFVVDHIVPLKRGGADSPENMQWEDRATAKAKDRVE